MNEITYHEDKKGRKYIRFEKANVRADRLVMTLCAFSRTGRSLPINEVPSVCALGALVHAGYIKKDGEQYRVCDRKEFLGFQRRIYEMVNG